MECEEGESGDGNERDDEGRTYVEDDCCDTLQIDHIFAVGRSESGMLFIGRLRTTSPLCRQVSRVLVLSRRRCVGVDVDWSKPAFHRLL